MTYFGEPFPAMHPEHDAQIAERITHSALLLSGGAHISMGALCITDAQYTHAHEAMEAALIPEITLEDARAMTPEALAGAAALRLANVLALPVRPYSRRGGDKVLTVADHIMGNRYKEPEAIQFVPVGKEIPDEYRSKVFRMSPDGTQLTVDAYPFFPNKARYAPRTATMGIDCVDATAILPFLRVGVRLAHKVFAMNLLNGLNPQNGEVHYDLRKDYGSHFETGEATLYRN